MKNIALVLLMVGNLVSSQNIPMYVGTYTDAESEGIYRFNFNQETGELTNRILAAKTANPSYITFSSDKKFVYAVSEANNGSVSAYSVNSNGTLKFLNNVNSNGGAPCHIQLDNENDKAVVSNYSGGNFSIYNIEKNGTLEVAFQVVDNNSVGIKGHAHSAKFFKNELFIADLGRNFLSQYVENGTQYILKKNYMMAKKAGPRHFEISKKGDFIYVINELNSTVTILKRDSDKFSEIQTIGTLRDDYKGMNSCADIHLSKDEKFLYGSNRGENTIVVYRRNSENGMLEKIQSISVEGDWPRNFSLSPNGKFLLVANQRSDNISVFEVNKETGELAFLKSYDAPIPVCLLF